MKNKLTDKYMGENMKIETVVAIFLISVIAIIKLLEKYLIEHNIQKEKIMNINQIKENFINEYYKWIFALIIIVTAFSKFYKFGEIPEYVGVDEAAAAYDSYCLANYGVDRYLLKYPLYLINFGGGQSALYAYSTIPFIKLFGANIITYRLPELLFFIMGMIISCVLVYKVKDKKSALLYSFLIMTCPWYIEASRQGLDCNLLAPMFMLDLLLLFSAQKDWHFAVAGISIGITLYTYALSWLLIPVFLVLYIAYSLYMKKINFKQIIILGIPIFILAIPLIYLILLNNGYVSKTDFGISTIPKLPYYRVGEISFSNIFECGLTGIQSVFLNKYSLFFVEVPFLIIGIIDGISDFVLSIKTKKFNFNGFITATFVLLFITNLMVNVPSINKINIVYFPMLYVIMIGIIKISDKSYIIPVITIVIISTLFINFEIEYFDTNKRDIRNETNPYEDREILKITEQIQGNSENEDAHKYFITEKVVQPYIYSLMITKTSPYELQATRNKSDNPVYITAFSNYSFGRNELDDATINEICKDKKFIVIIHKKYQNNIEKFEQIGKNITEYDDYKIIKNY